MAELRADFSRRDTFLAPCRRAGRRSTERDSGEFILFLDWIIETEERGWRLAAQLEPAPDFGWSTRRTCASLSRYVFCELLLAGVAIERVSILLVHQSVRITEKHYAPWVRALQEQLEADVRRTWETPEPKRRVRGGYAENDARVIPFKSEKEWWRRGSRNIKAY